MFPIDKRITQMVWYPAPDVIPALIDAVEAVPQAQWNEHQDLYELADAIAPVLEQHGARKWDLIWSMERHFSEPYGPLPKARQTFMAGIPDMFLQDAAERADPGDDTPIETTPLQYEPGMPIPDEYREWLEKLFFAHGECMLPIFGPDAVGQRSHYYTIDEFLVAVAPDAESRLRVNNFTAEEFKHQYQFYHLYSQFDPAIPMRIYEREKAVFRAYQDVQPMQDWTDRAAFHMLADRFGVYQGFEWVQSSYAPLARVSLQVVKDERGHSNYGYIHVRDAIEQGGREVRERLQQRIDDFFYPSFMASFGSATSRNNRMWRKWGLKLHPNDRLRVAYHQEMEQVLESLGLRAPELEVALAKGQEQAAARAARAGVQKVAN
ncbi:MAG: Phenylacetic acid catabolic protein [Burkholderiaceae bacterium]